MNKSYPSKKAKRKAEYLRRKEKRDKWKRQMSSIKEAESMEELAAALGVRLR